MFTRESIGAVESLWPPLIVALWGWVEIEDHMVQAKPVLLTIVYCLFLQMLGLRAFIYVLSRTVFLM